MKGTFPYEWFDSLDRMDEQSLPSIECFNSELTEREMTEESYSHAKLVWDTFEMESMWDYHDLYLVTDVLLLADVLTVFRNNCLENYKLDPFQFYTLPGFAWEAMLLMTKEELELISDTAMYLFIEDALRGGMSTISIREADSNVPGTVGYDSTKPTKHLIYLDANNQYGWAMSQPLPHKGFEWMTFEEIVKFRDTGTYNSFHKYHI